MKAALLIVVLSFLLLGISFIPQGQVVSQAVTHTISTAYTYTYVTPTTVQAQLPSLDVLRAFVTNLINIYNGLVTEHYSGKALDAVKGNFVLYHENDTSFNVTVMQAEPYSTYTVVFIFAPIHATQPNITIDHKDTFRGLFPNCTTLGNGPGILPQKNFSLLSSTGIVVQFYFVLQVPLVSISPSSDYITYSNIVARSLYDGDEKAIPPFGQTQILTQTSFLTQEQTNSLQSNQSILNHLLERAKSLAWAIVTVLVLFFGGLREAIKLADPKERNKAINEIKQLFRLLGLYRTKKANQIQKENTKVAKTNKESRTQEPKKVEKKRGDREQTQ